jgi:Molybdate transporter of MFS superfamily
MEVAGAFGDLGTLVPFVVAYLGVLKMDPFGVLLAFGTAMVVCGFVYRTPIPVQPMKAAGAIATTQAAQTITITPTMVYGASLATGLVWLLLGLTGTAHRVANLIKRPVVVGIILGLGFGFMIEGAKMMAQNWWIAGPALLCTSLLLTNRVIPAMFTAHVWRGLRPRQRPHPVRGPAWRAHRAAHAFLCTCRADPP